MKKTVRYVVDRREGDLLVLIPDEGQKELLLDAKKYSFRANDVLDVFLDGDTVLSVTLREGEADKREQAMKARLSALFAKGKKPNA